MTATSHALLGAVIAAKFSDPTIAVPLAFASHILADAFPHWDSGTNEPKKGRDRVRVEAVFDVLLGFLLSYLLITKLFPTTDLQYAFIIILVSQALDWLTAPYYFFKINNPPIFRWTYRFQKMFDNRLDKPWGIINQVVVIVAIIIAAKLL